MVNVSSNLENKCTKTLFKLKNEGIKDIVILGESDLTPESKPGLDPKLAGLFDHIFEIEPTVLSDKLDRREALEWFLKKQGAIVVERKKDKKCFKIIFNPLLFLSGTPDLLDSMAEKTSGFLLEDLRILVQRAVSHKNKRYDKFYNPKTDLTMACKNTFKLEEIDFETALNYLQSVMADAIGAPKIPNVQWKDVGMLQIKKVFLASHI